MEESGLLVVHALCLGFGDLLSQLALGKDADGVDTAHALGGIRVFRREVDAVFLHGLLPCHGMTGHRVVEHAVHVEQHALESVPPIWRLQLLLVAQTVDIVADSFSKHSR